MVVSVGTIRQAEMDFFAENTNVTKD